MFRTAAPGRPSPTPWAGRSSSPSPVCRRWCFLQSRALKAIAVTSRQRSPRFPDIPALAETRGFEQFDFTNWFGLLARVGTPAGVLERLHKATHAALQDAQVREILMAQAAEPVGNTPAEFREFIRAEIAKYGKVVELTSVKVK